MYENKGSHDKMTEKISDLLSENAKTRGEKCPNSQEMNGTVVTMCRHLRLLKAFDHRNGRFVTVP